MWLTWKSHVRNDDILALLYASDVLEEGVQDEESHEAQEGDHSDGGSKITGIGVSIVQANAFSVATRWNAAKDYDWK